LADGNKLAKRTERAETNEVDSDNKMSDELEVGSPSPEFSLPANTGGEVALADYRGKANVILFFVREYN
jgi:hypothetical protein